MNDPMVPSTSTSTLGYALLGLLARRDLSGYDLAAQMKRSVGYFWQARHSQIYPELAKLEAAGLVRHLLIHQTDRPDKKIYAVTDAGRAALISWLTSPIAEAGTRDELVLRAYLIWLADPLQAATLFRDQQRHHAARQAEYEAILVALETTHGPALRRPGSIPFASYAALRRGIGYEREYAEWCGWLAEALGGATSAEDLE